MNVRKSALEGSRGLCTLESTLSRNGWALVGDESSLEMCQISHARLQNEAETRLTQPEFQTVKSANTANDLGKRKVFVGVY